MKDPDFQKAIAFIQGLGIKTEYRTIAEEDCFLPGLLIEKGKIIIDPGKLKYPGDILHEAAHIAVLPRSVRAKINGPLIGKRRDAVAEEMMAIAWSYAACCHLAIHPSFVFHEQGYRGGAATIIENFGKGNYIGVPVLQWLGMTTTNKDGSTATYPSMIKWLRD